MTGRGASAAGSGAGSPTCGSPGTAAPSTSRKASRSTRRRSAAAGAVRPVAGSPRWPAAGGGGGRGEAAAGLGFRRRDRRRGRREAADHLQRHRPDRQAPGMGRDVRRRLADCMKYRFYDPKLHGTDWDAMRAKYKPLVAYVADRQELMNVINEMIGELNASHTGASAGRGRAAARPSRRRPDPPPGPRPPAGRGQRTLQGRPRLRGRARRQGLDQGREGELPDRHRRQADQGRRRLLRIPRPPAQPQGRADAQRQARGRGRLEGQVRADPAGGLQPPPLRALGQGAAGHGRQALRRPGRLPAHPGDGPALAGQVQEGARRVPPQGGPGHRRALERRRQHRAGAAGASWSSAPTRSGSRAAPSRPSGRSPATSAPRSCSRTGGAPPTPRCSPPASAPWASAR